MHVLVIRTGSERFGLELSQVEEVTDGVAVVGLHGLPKHLPGLVDHRGQMLPAVDLGLLAGAFRSRCAATVVLRSAGQRSLALLVETIESTEELNEGTLVCDDPRPWVLGRIGDVRVLRADALLEEPS